MQRLLLIFGIVSLLTNTVTAQTAQKESKFGIETDILWPFLVQTTRTHFTVKLWQKGHLRGDVYVGLNIDFPRERETEGRFADYSLASGYRQYTVLLERTSCRIFSDYRTWCSAKPCHNRKDLQ